MGIQKIEYLTSTMEMNKALTCQPQTLSPPFSPNGILNLHNGG